MACSGYTLDLQRQRGWSKAAVTAKARVKAAVTVPTDMRVKVKVSNTIERDESKGT